jgi:hypothetical protein
VGAILHEIAVLVFPDAAPDAGPRVLAVLAGYPAKLPRSVSAQVNRASQQRADASRADAAAARAQAPLRLSMRPPEGGVTATEPGCSSPSYVSRIRS